MEAPPLRIQYKSAALNLRHRNAIYDRGSTFSPKHFVTDGMSQPEHCLNPNYAYNTIVFVPKPWGCSSG